MLTVFWLFGAFCWFWQIVEFWRAKRDMEVLLCIVIVLAMLNQITDCIRYALEAAR